MKLVTAQPVDEKPVTPANREPIKRTAQRLSLSVGQAIRHCRSGRLAHVVDAAGRYWSSEAAALGKRPAPLLDTYVHVQSESEESIVQSLSPHDPRAVSGDGQEEQDRLGKQARGRVHAGTQRQEASLTRWPPRTVAEWWAAIATADFPTEPWQIGGAA